MLVHDRFVFLHMPKTGGTFVRRFLQRELEGLWTPDNVPRNLHHGAAEIPSWAADRPVLLFVRNPWSWYVSWHRFLVEHAARVPAALRSSGPLTRWLLGERRDGDGLADFTVALRRACGGSDGDALARAARDSGMLELAGSGDGVAEDAAPWLPAQELGRFLLEGHDVYSAGLLTALADRIEADSISIGRYESLVADLERFLGEAGVALSADARGRLHAAEPVNVSAHGPYRDYYSLELQTVVAESCEMTIDRFGYGF